MSLKTRLADVEKSIPRGSAPDRAALAAATDEELRAVLGEAEEGRFSDDPIGHRLADMEPAERAALLRGRS